MRITLERHEPIALSQLPDALEGSGPATESLGVEVDLSAAVATLERLRERTDDRNRSAWDAEMAAPVHEALAPALTRRQATDPGLWHWLCISTMFREYVWLRWHGLVPADNREALGDRGVSSHFIGGASLVGLARNAVARLYWTRETLLSGADDVEEADALVRDVLQRTDLFAAIFERRVGLHPPAARAAVRTLLDVGEDQHRAAMITLNHVATTVPLERMDESEVTSVLRRSLDRAAD